MNINFEYHGVSASNRLEILAASKLAKLEDKYDFIVNVDVYFKKENTSTVETGKICSVRINTPGPTLFAEASKAEFEQSIGAVMEDLRRQLQKRKDKMKAH